MVRAGVLEPALLDGQGPSAEFNRLAYSTSKVCSTNQSLTRHPQAQQSSRWSLPVSGRAAAEDAMRLAGPPLNNLAA